MERLFRLFYPRSSTVCEQTIDTQVRQAPFFLLSTCPTSLEVGCVSFTHTEMAGFINYFCKLGGCAVEYSATVLRSNADEAVPNTRHVAGDVIHNQWLIQKIVLKKSSGSKLLDTEIHIKANGFVKITCPVLECNGDIEIRWLVEHMSQIFEKRVLTNVV
jgi:hypothetical protein